MKKLLLITLAFCWLNSFSQIFLSTDGILYQGDNDYIVLDFPEKDAKTLYKNALFYINETYKSPKDVIRGDVDAQYLSFSTYKEVKLFVKTIDVIMMGADDSGYIKYNTNLYFKDGRVKLSFSELEIWRKNPNFRYPLNTQKGVYSIYKKGDLRNPRVKRRIESAISSTYYKLIIAFEQNGSFDGDDW
jgi:hypothetical protein|tara:strand:- start:4110 stop:4673 length:564 start_codon:yes stop_codon:yes gene_type:complete